jgi:hypothetical protein
VIDMNMPTVSATTKEVRASFRETAWVSVLNDNETYTGLDGCWIAPTPPDVVEKLNEGDEVDDIPLSRFDLEDLIQWAIDNGYFDGRSSGS